MPSFRACGARPSAKWPSDAKKALRRKPGDDGKGGFLGGTHSVRPRSMAFRMPGHLIATPSVGERPGGLPGTCLGQARALTVGVRSPPLRGGRAKVRGPCGGNPGMTRRAFFSEGCALRVRVARHHGWQKVSSMAKDGRETGCPMAKCLAQTHPILAGLRRRLSARGRAAWSKYTDEITCPTNSCHRS